MPELAYWLELFAFERVRYVTGNGWQARPADRQDDDAWAPIADPQAWFTRLVLDGLRRSPLLAGVRVELADTVRLSAAIDRLRALVPNVAPAPAPAAVPASRPASRRSPASSRPDAIVIDLASARRRRLARAS